LRELGFLFRADGERAHGVRLTAVHGRRQVFIPFRDNHRHLFQTVGPALLRGQFFSKVAQASRLLAT
jgi:hypothetical protein